MNTQVGLRVFKDKRLYILAGVIALALAIFATSQHSENVYANPITTPNGGTLRAWVESYTPNSRDGNMCNNNQRNRPNFSAYLTAASIQIGDPSKLVFDMTVEYRQCKLSTEAYAIYSRDYCPLAGNYGGSGPDFRAKDCIKFIPATPYNATDDNPSLGCPVLGFAEPEKRNGDPNRRCTTWEGRTYVLKTHGRPASRPPQEQPQQILNTGGSININQIKPTTKTTGSYIFGGNPDDQEGRICQYWWYSHEDVSKAQRECRHIKVVIKWEYTPPPPPTWNLAVATSMSVGGGVRGNDSSNPYSLRLMHTNRADWHHTIINNGPNATGVGTSWTVYQDPNGTPTHELHGVAGQTGIWEADQPPGWGHNAYTTTFFGTENAGQKFCQTIGINPSGGVNGVATYEPKLSTPRCVKIVYYRITPSLSNTISDTFVATPPAVSGKITPEGVVEDTHEVKLSAYKFNDSRVFSSGQLNQRTSSTEEPCSISGLQSVPGYASECRDATPALSNHTGSPNPQPVNRGFETFGFSEGPYPVGTTFCYVLSVKNPTESTTDDTRWYHSAIKCTLSVSKPKMEVWGGDVKATGEIQTSFYDITQGQNRRHGSWGEYGVFSNGVNSYMGSGAGLATAQAGYAQSAWSSLTFGNFPAYGNFGDSSLAPAPISKDGAVKYTNLTVDSIDDLLPDGKTQAKIEIEDTLTINGNLIYSSDPDERFDSINKLKKVVIHAKNIIIGADVTQIDPWLIAENISTCSQISGFRPMTDGGLLSSGMCEKRLKFNGVVDTDNIYLYRTYDDTEGKSAETFNLRADNILSSYTGGGDLGNPVAITSSVTELPPRF